MTIVPSFRTSLIFSIIIQLTAGLITLLTLFIPIDDKFNYLYSLVAMDTFVQFIQASFYSLFLYYNVSAYQASKIRYFDWFITTPIMIITTVAFFFYNSKHTTISNKTTPSREGKISFFREKIIKPMNDFINYSSHKSSLAIILISNFLMLLFGYLGELGILSILSATFIGFIFFFIEFYYIYKDFVVPYGDYNTYFYYTVFTIVWGLYGVAYIFNDKLKNISYNILDLISKNIYGLLLGYSIYSMREQ